VAALAAASHPTTLWVRRPELATSINRDSENPEYLPGRRLPYGLRATVDLAEAVSGAGALVMAVPSHGFRQVFAQLSPLIPPDLPILSLVKGIEQETMRRMTEVVIEESPDHDPTRIGVLTGPNLASEVMDGSPAASVIAMTDTAAAAALQEVFMSPRFRVYTNRDVIGCETAGALKNVMAIAAGMAKGLGFGHNTLAALITRALAEISRLGTALGGRAETFAGLAGMGDLIATCQSDASRNNRVGMALAEGHTLDDIVTEMKMVAEGVKTVRPVLALASAAGVEMPIAQQVERVLYQGAHPREAVLTLMTREARSEGYGDG
jgi:glycerol-3-phosphate dehydrogenase (NAD(P)+)